MIITILTNMGTMMVMMKMMNGRTINPGLAT